MFLKNKGRYGEWTKLESVWNQIQITMKANEIDVQEWKCIKQRKEKGY